MLKQSKTAVLITGGGGYIAESLNKALHTKYNVTVIARRDFDLRDTYATAEWFCGRHFDVVIHTAADGGSRLRQEDHSVINNNLRMFYNLVDNEHCFDRLISFGSGAEIYLTDKPYGYSKRIIADEISSKEKYYNIRIYAVFDENELDTRFIKANLRRYLNREDIVIHQDRYMDFFYMQDLVSLVDYYITALDPKKEIDCCYNYHLTLKEVANIINNLDDYRLGVDILSDQVAPAYTGDCVDMVIPLIGLEQGIRNVYRKLR